jgi:hypothetical protein
LIAFHSQRASNEPELDLIAPDAKYEKKKFNGKGFNRV